MPLTCEPVSCTPWRSRTRTEALGFGWSARNPVCFGSATVTLAEETPSTSPTVRDNAASMPRT